MSETRSITTVSGMSPGELATSGLAVMRAKWALRSCEHLGERVRVRGRPAISNYGRLRIGSRVQIVSTVATTELAVGSEGLLEIGEQAFINYGCSISAFLHVEIGPRCNLGTHVMIMDNDFHRIEPERRNERPESAPIRLEENVWVGGRAIIMNGVTIGQDSVIGAGSVVVEDVPPRSVAAGIPARVIRSF